MHIPTPQPKPNPFTTFLGIFIGVYIVKNIDPHKRI